MSLTLFGRVAEEAPNRLSGWRQVRVAASGLANELESVILLSSLLLADLTSGRRAAPADPIVAARSFPARLLEWAHSARRRVPGGRPVAAPVQMRQSAMRGVTARARRRVRLEQLAKRTLDVGVAGFALAVLAPLLLVCAAAIRIETPGPALFRQRRSGLDGRPFVIWKFRTMTVMEDGPVIVQATQSDPRVTRVGAMLRRSSIDELPQLFNVLRGDMSLVGPRPHAVAHDMLYEACIARYRLRYRVRPGVTGWAQVHGLRGETRRVRHMVRRVAYDVWYVDNWSFGLDLRILLMTCLMMFRPDREGAVRARYRGIDEISARHR